MDKGSVKVAELNKEISMTEYMVHEVWHMWRVCLAMAQTRWRIGAAALQGNSSWEPVAGVKMMTEEEWETFEQWKSWFLEDSVEVGALGLEEWSR